eukprot:COSAG01_NODE_4128_length_5325_cov_4.201493_3_plen_168_part_00
MQQWAARRRQAAHSTGINDGTSAAAAATRAVVLSAPSCAQPPAANRHQRPLCCCWPAAAALAWVHLGDGWLRGTPPCLPGSMADWWEANQPSAKAALSQAVEAVGRSRSQSGSLSVSESGLIPDSELSRRAAASRPAWISYMILASKLRVFFRWEPAPIFFPSAPSR